MSGIEEMNIPPLPGVVVEVMKFDHTDPDSSAADLEKIIQPDKGISSEVLRVANSAYYGRSGRIKILKDAVTLLGIKALKNLIIFLSTKAMTGKLKGAMFHRYLEEYPVLSALLAQQIAQTAKKQDIIDEAFLASLLNKIGMSILAVNKGEHYSFLIEQAEQNSFDLKELEKSSYDTDHIELGLEAAKAWNLPDTLITTSGIDSTTAADSLKTDIEKITYIAIIAGKKAAAIPVTGDQEKQASMLYENVGGTGDLFQKHLSDQSLQRLKQHPYYQMSAG